MNLEKFNKLSEFEQRVAIAQDVIARIESKKVSQKRGSYLVYKSAGKPLSQIYQMSAQKFLKENKCYVCAKGALVMSWVAQFNHYKFGQIYDSPCIREIEQIFSQSMRNAMECAFEGWVNHILGLNFKNRKMSLKSVMKNIVKNKGYFKVQGQVFF